MGNEVATREQQLQKQGMAVAGYLGSTAMRKKLANCLPEHITPERMIRVALTAATRNPRLLECTLESLGLALLTSSQLGLEPNGRDAHLVPYRNKKSGKTDCQLIPDYKGLIQLAYRSGQVDNVSAKAVFAKDLFEYEFGSNEHLKHVPTEEEEPGALRYAWAMVRFKGGGSKFVVLNRRDILRRMKSSQTAGRDDGPWQTHTEAMWAKSAVKELGKWMPQSPEMERFHQAVEADDSLEFPGAIDVESAEVPTNKAEELAGRLKDVKKAVQPTIVEGAETRKEPIGPHRERREYVSPRGTISQLSTDPEKSAPNTDPTLDKSEAQEAASEETSQEDPGMDVLSEYQVALESADNELSINAVFEDARKDKRLIDDPTKMQVVSRMVAEAKKRISKKGRK
jgi:phage RecT family recombinase